VITGIGQVAMQSTNFSMLLGLGWPGSLTAEMRGASVVQLIEGARWLRAYGTLPHPNILGGFVFVLLSGPILLSLTSVKQKLFRVLLFGAGIILLMLTFSRSAWLGIGVFALFILFNFRKFQLRHLILLSLVGILCVSAVIVPLRSLFFTRLGDEQAQTEQASTFTRLWLLQRTVEMVQENPWLGTGIGSYSLALSQHVALSYDIEPVHNVPLLALSELGVGGFTLVIGLGISFALGLINRRSPESVIISGVVIGLLTISLLDHYLWTLAPGRILCGTIFGLWANCYKKDDENT
jgi:O-antigen ligase